MLLLYLIAITSTWTLALTLASQEDMLLWKWRQWADAKYDKGSEWVQPLIRCPWCLPSIHSLVGYAFAVGMELITVFSWRLVVIWPLVICGSSLVNAVVWGIFTLIMNKNEYYEGLDMKDYQDPNDESVVDDEPKESYYKRI